MIEKTAFLLLPWKAKKKKKLKRVLQLIGSPGAPNAARFPQAAAGLSASIAAILSPGASTEADKNEINFILLLLGKKTWRGEKTGNK